MNYCGRGIYPEYTEQSLVLMDLPGLKYCQYCQLLVVVGCGIFRFLQAYSHERPTFDAEGAGNYLTNYGNIGAKQIVWRLMRMAML